MTKSTCVSTKHQDYDCLIYGSINKKFRSSMWCKPCQAKQAERANRQKEESK